MPHAVAHDAVMPNRKPLREVLGTSVRVLRTAKKMSQAQVAAAGKRSGLQIDGSTIGRIERFEIPTTIDSIAALARGLGVEAWQLLVDKIEPDKLPELGSGELATDERELLRKYRQATARWRMALQHLAALRADQQNEVSEGTMVLLAKAAAEPAKDERVAEHYGTAPHVVHERGAPPYRKRGE